MNVANALPVGAGGVVVPRRARRTTLIAAGSCGALPLSRSAKLLPKTLSPRLNDPLILGAVGASTGRSNVCDAAQTSPLPGGSISWSHATMSLSVPPCVGVKS